MDAHDVERLARQRPGPPFHMKSRPAHMNAAAWMHMQRDAIRETARWAPLLAAVVQQCVAEVRVGIEQGRVKRYDARFELRRTVSRRLKNASHGHSLHQLFQRIWPEYARSIDWSTDVPSRVEAPANPPGETASNPRAADPGQSTRASADSEPRHLSGAYG